jgi:hypothetical protein
MSSSFHGVGRTRYLALNTNASVRESRLYFGGSRRIFRFRGLARPEIGVFPLTKIDPDVQPLPQRRSQSSVGREP